MKHPSFKGVKLSCIYTKSKRDRVASLVLCVVAVGSTLIPVAAERGRGAAVAACRVCAAVGVPGTLLPLKLDPGDVSTAPP